MEVEFFTPSDKALKVQNNQYQTKHNFPFDRVPIGMSFRVEVSQIKNIASLRTLASRNGLKFNKKFKVIDHHSSYEVFRME